VHLLGVVKAAGTGEAAADARVLATGSVWSVVEPTAGGGSAGWWVSLLVPEESQNTVAQAAADGLLRLSLVGASE
jgi:hypothetical protein